MRRSTLKKLGTGGLVAAGALALTAGPAAAQTVDPSVPGVFADNAFVLICGALVVFMQAGFAMLEAGLTRAKNAAHMMLKNLFDFVVGAFGFALVGYHIAYNGADFVGFNWLWGGPTDAAPGAPNLTTGVHFFFNMGFAAAAATIVSGAVAERVKLKAYFIYAVFISTLVYPVVVSWTWGGGWLSGLSTPFVDFAGSTVVHATGGMAALLGAAFAGPRIGRYDKDGNSLPIPGHNLPMAMFGVIILVVGWFGFNSGSMLGADLHIGHVAALTAVAGAAGGIGATGSTWLSLRTPDVTLIGNGVLGGLVGVTAGAANLSVIGAVVVGLAAGIIATQGALLLDRRQIDDPVGAVPVHLFCGVWGTLALGFLADPDAAPGGDGPAGILLGGSPALLVSQLIGVLAILSFVTLTVGVMFMVTNSLGELRVSPDHEAAGLDLAEHATPAYNEDAVEYGGDDELDELLDELSNA
ncbi:MAG: ammonium transporter [Actinomycetota bacterium]